jgi:uncharacterized peroxidase-related enzyme
MTWICTVGENEATGLLKERYQADLDELGFVMESTKSLSARAALALAYDALRKAVWQTPGLTLRERRLINLAVADRLGSTYCVLVYACALGHNLGPAAIRAVLHDYHHAGLTDRDVAILDYAVAAVLGHAREEHIGRLREVGLDDAAILDVAVTANLRLFGSRIYDAVGAETDPFFLEQTDLVEAIKPHGTPTSL